MHKETNIWQFVADRLEQNESVILLAVTQSSGSSPGRCGFKMIVAGDAMCGSVGGGVMEMRLVDHARRILSASQHSDPLHAGLSYVTEQIHRKDVQNASGMICSGKQSVIQKLLQPDDAGTVSAIIESLTSGVPASLTITPTRFDLAPPERGTQNYGPTFEKVSETEFVYVERLGFRDELYIVGGGHCALALSELAAKMDFRISIFDDRPDLNTIAKNRFAHEIKIIESYETIGGYIPSGSNIYVAVMTLGYRSDETVIRSLFDKDLKYFGVLGSRAKMKTLIKNLEAEGFSKERLARIRTPIGLPINSHTPEEIAISIAAEIIAVKNS